MAKKCWVPCNTYTYVQIAANLLVRCGASGSHLHLTKVHFLADKGSCLKLTFNKGDKILILVSIVQEKQSTVILINKILHQQLLEGAKLEAMAKSLRIDPNWSMMYVCMNWPYAICTNKYVLLNTILHDIGLN